MEIEQHLVTSIDHIRMIKNAPVRTRGRLSPQDLTKAVQRITEFVAPYAEVMKTDEQGRNLLDMVLGLTSDLERKSVEPIASRAGVERRTLQGFVGINHWDDDPLRRLERVEVARELGCPGAALIIDGSATPKQGKHTVGVKRQWCGHEGKVDNCVVGVHAVFAGKHDLAALVDSQLYLPREWTDDDEKRERGHVPDDVAYATQPELATMMVERLAKELPFTWVLADTEFGRVQTFRTAIRSLGKYYALEVPKDTVVSRIQFGITARKEADSVERWAERINKSRYKEVHLRDGEKQPLNATIAAVPVWVGTDGSAHREVLLVLRRSDDPKTHYFLVHAPPRTAPVDMARQASRRHLVEEVFAECKSEVGMDHFEVRAWHGWHHHMTLVQISHWFLIRIALELGHEFRPAITVSIVRQLLAKLLAPLATAEYMADWANRQMDRNDDVREAHYAARRQR